MRFEENRRVLVCTVMMYMPMKDGETEDKASWRMQNLAEKSGLEFDVLEEEVREI